MYGYESVGKTTFGMGCIKEVQRIGGLGILIDTEATFTEHRAMEIGINLDQLVYIEEEYIEPILNSIHATIERLKDTPAIIFWDTIAGTPSRGERGRSVGEASLGLHARALSQGLRRLSRPLSKSNAVLLLCNQLKEGAMGKLFAQESEKDATLGGRAIRFHSEIRLKLSRSKSLTIKDGKKYKDIGFETIAKIVKNKSYASGHKARMVFRYDINGQYDAALSCARTLQDWGVIPLKADQFKLDGTTYPADRWRRLYKNKESFRTYAHKVLRARYLELYGRVSEEEED